MLHGATIRQKLLAVAFVSAFGLLALAGFSAYSGQKSTAALERVYNKDVQTLVQLQKINSGLGEVRFHIAGVLLDVISVQGALNRVRDERTELQSEWSSVVANGTYAEDSPERTLVEGMTKELPRVLTTLDRIEKAYETNDNNQLSDLLESDWGAVVKGFIKPLHALILTCPP